MHRSIARSEHVVKQALSGGFVYFTLVFAVGFVLGTIRTLWIAPKLGTRIAELAEAPLMLAVSLVAASWVVHRWQLPGRASVRLVCGGWALTLMLVVEFTFVLRMRGITIRDYLATLDLISGGAYYLALLIFAILPLLVGNAKNASDK